MAAAVRRRQHLFEVLRKHPLQRKVLLTASHAQGHMLLEQVSREYGPVLNTEVRTLEAWVLERVKLLLMQKGLRYISPSESRWIVCRMLQSETASDSVYLDGINISPGVTYVFHQAVMELRDAGVLAEALHVDDFENEEKGRFVKRLLQRYEEELKQKQFVDLAGLLLWAKQIPPMAMGVIAIVDEDVVRTLLHRQLLHALTGGSYIALAEDPMFTAPDSLFPIKSAELFHASGVLAEVREVFRRIEEMSIAWDQVELVLSNDEPYAGAVYTVSSGAEIRCTFAKGLSIGLTNAGKAAKLFLDWMEAEYNVDYMLLALKQRYIRVIDSQQEQVATAGLIRELERTGIGWGKERYRLLEKRISAKDSNEEAIGALRVLHTFFQHVFSILTEDVMSSPRRLLQSLITFISDYVVLQDESEYQVLSELKDLEQSLAAAGELTMDTALTLQYVREELEQLRIQASGTPSPGHIHVTSLVAGGQTGRPYTFILGMSEKNWKASARQDPVLLDEERVRIDSELVTSTERVRRSLEQRGQRIGMIRGKCIMSFCSYDTAESQENMPAYEMLQVYRMQSGQPEADYEKMLRSLNQRVGFAGRRTGSAIDAADIWINALLTDDSRIKNGSEAVFAFYPHAANGAMAAQARAGSALSPYDGLVHPGACPVAGADPDTEQRAYSASKLELYARCPLQYFYQEILRVRVKDTAAYDRAKWLDAMQRGSLMHEVFNRYLTEMKERRTQTIEPLTHDEGRLKELTEQVIRKFLEDIPAPSEHIFRKECDSIRKDVNIFFVNELRKTSIPVHMELQLHDEEKPMHVELSDELTLPLRGYVDRVDEVGPHQYKIYDYKTGNPRKFKHNECFSGGTQLQLPLYGVAVEQWMRQTGYDSEARVIDSAYYFPTEKGMGEEVGRPQNRRHDLANLVATMQEAMKQGLFPPTTEPKNCTWCDYKSVCGAHAEYFAEKWERPEAGERLTLLLEVKRYD